MNIAARLLMPLLCVGVFVSCGTPDRPATGSSPTTTLPTAVRPPATAPATAVPIRPTSVPTSVPTTSPQPSHTPSIAPATALKGDTVLKLPTGVQSYRAHLEQRFDGFKAGEAVTGTMLVDERFSQQPLALRTTGQSITHPNFTGWRPNSTIDLVQIESDRWLKVDGVVVVTETTTFPPQSSLAEFAEYSFSLLDHVATATLQETGSIVNGFPAHHYRFTLSDMVFPATTTPGARTIEHLDGELWLSATAGYIVQMRMTVQGTGLFVDLADHVMDGTVTTSYQLLAVNEPVTIDAPADDPPGGFYSGIGTEIPVPPDSQMEQSAPGFAMFRLHNFPLDTFVAYYRQEMAARGWTEIEQRSEAGSDHLTFRKDERVVLIRRSTTQLIIFEQQR
jgi:hypothetical protein